MSIGMVGRKRGMTRVFLDNGASVPVSLLEALPNRVVQVKTVEKDGYAALQVTAGHRRPSLLSKPVAGHYAKAKVDVGAGLWELRLDHADAAKFQVGNEVKIEDAFTLGQKVDVAGITKGKGFAGTIKRHHFTMGDATHGNSLSHRSPGSIGQRQTPGRVFKGKRMAGHMGSKRQSIQNLEVVRMDPAQNLMAVKGSVPGFTGAYVFISPAAKAGG